MQEINNDYILSLFESCEILSKSSRTVSRYVRKGMLHPMAIKSRQGTLEYRFSRSEIEALKAEEDRMRQITYLQQDGSISRPGAASFASVNYQEPRAIPQIPFVQPMPSPQANVKNSEPDLYPNSGMKHVQPKKDEATTKADKHERRDSILISSHEDKEIVTLLKETTEMLRGQLKVKDDQIKNLDEKIGQLIERNRETNILLKGLQDKVGLLEAPKGDFSKASASENIPEPMPKHDPVVEVAPMPAAEPDILKKENKKIAKEKNKKGNGRDRKTEAEGKSFFKKLFG